MAIDAAFRSGACAGQSEKHCTSNQVCWVAKSPGLGLSKASGVSGSAGYVCAVPTMAGVTRCASGIRCQIKVLEASCGFRFRQPNEVTSHVYLDTVPKSRFFWMVYCTVVRAMPRAFAMPCYSGTGGVELLFNGCVVSHADGTATIVYFSACFLHCVDQCTVSINALCCRMGHVQ